MYINNKFGGKYIYRAFGVVWAHSENEVLCVQDGFQGNVTLTLYLGGMLNDEGYVGGAIRKYTYVNVWFLSLFGVVKLCLNERYSDANIVMSYVWNRME